MLRLGRVLLLTSLYGLSAVLPKALGFFVLLWIAKILSSQDYAVFGLLYAMQAGLGTLTLCGIVEVVVARTGNNGLSNPSCLNDSANSTFVLMTIGWCAIGAFALSNHALSGVGLESAMAAIVSGIAIGFTTLQSQLLVIQERHHSAIGMQFIVSGSSFLGGGLSFYMHPSVGAYFIGATAATLAALVVLALGQIGSFRFSVIPQEVRQILFNVPPFILIGFLGWISGYGNNYIIGSLLTLHDVADFTFLLSLSAIIQIVGSSLNQVWAPRLYKLYQADQIEEMEKQSGRAFGMSALAMGLASGVMLILYKPMIDLVGGNLIAYREKTVELAFMSATYLCVIPWWHCQNYFIASGRSKDMLRSAIAGTILGFGTWIGMVVWLGSSGVFVGYCAQGAVRSLVMLQVARQYWSIRVPWGSIFLGFALVGAGLL